MLSIPNRIRSLFLVSIFCWCGLSAAVNPPGSGWLDVTNYGVIPDDGGDDTLALQTLIGQVIGDRTNFATLYFPNGVYNISDTLEWKDASGAWKCFLRLQGQSRDGVVLKLADHTFTDSNNPQAMVFTASTNGGGPERPDGSGNTAFSNYIQDMTLDVGVGNSGAIGIDYIANNIGAIRRVKIISSDPARSGFAGIQMDRNAPGPALLKEVEIIGFDYALDLNNQIAYSTTGEDIQIREQRIAGIRSNRQPLHLHRLYSDNTVPVLIADDNSLSADGMAVLVNSVLTGGDPANYAIEYNGGLLLRDVSIEGYRAAPIHDNNNAIDAGSGSIEEYLSHPAFSEFASPPRTLRLPIEEPPAYPQDSVADWVKVNGRNSVSIQAAFDQAAAGGKKTVYFPAGLYTIEETVTISGSVERVIGNHAFVVWQDSETDSVAFDINNLTGTVLHIEEFLLAAVSNNNPLTWFNDQTGTPLVLRDVTQNSGGVPYAHTLAKKIFFENCAIGGITFNGAQVWARQFNPENQDTTKLINDGGDLWVFGFKTEWPSTSLDARNGARSEIFGGMFYPPFGSNDPDQGYPAVINHESQLSLNVASYGNYNAVQVRDTRGGVTRDFLLTEVTPAGELRGGGTIPLYVSWEGVIPNAPTALQALSVGSHAVSLSWTDVASNEDAYVVQRRSSGGTWQTLVDDLAANSTQYTDDTLAALSAYEYRVLASRSGIESSASNVVAITTTGSTNAPAQATNLSATLTAADTVALSWTDASGNENGFRVERRADGGAWSAIATVDVNQTSVTDATLVEQVSYDYRVVATNDFGEAIPSVAASALLPIKAPGSLRAHAQGSGILLTWTDYSAVEAGYQLERQGGGSGWTAIAMTEPNQTVWLDTGVVDGTAYDYRVAAVAGDASLSTYVITSNARMMTTFAEEFESWNGDGFDLEYSQLTLRQRGPGVYDAFLKQGVTEFPVDTSSHPELALDYIKDAFGSPWPRWANYEVVNLAGGKVIPFFGQNYSEIWISVRGTIGLGQALTTTFGDLADIDERVGIAVAGQDLTPSDPNYTGGYTPPYARGSFYGLQTADAYVLTVVDVPTESSPFGNSFQAELFYSGDIRITWLEMDGGAAIIGLSDGVTPLAGAGFTETDISSYAEEPVLPPQHTLTVEASNGSVTRVPNLSQYFEGSVVTLKGVPDVGYGFGGWSGALNARANGASLQMNADASVQAWFFQDAPPPYHHDFDAYAAGDVVGQSTNGRAWANLWGSTANMDIVSYDGAQALALLGDGLVWDPQSDAERGFAFEPASSQVTFSFKIARSAAGSDGTDPRIFFGNANHQILGFAFWGRGNGVAAYVHGGTTNNNALINSANLVDSRGISMPTGASGYFEVQVDVDFGTDEVTAIRYNGLNILGAPVAFTMASQDVGIYLIGSNSTTMVPYLADVMLTSPDAIGGYPAWSAGLVEGPTGDDNSDGIVNLYAYALGASSGSALVPSMPGIAIESGQSVIRLPSEAADDLQQEVWMSSDLQVWERAVLKAVQGSWAVDPGFSGAADLSLIPVGDSIEVRMANPGDRAFYRMTFAP